MTCVWNKYFSGGGQAKNHHVVPYYWPISKEKVSPSEKVTPSEKVEKGTKMLDDIKDPVHTIFWQDLGHFQWKSTRSTRWFNIDSEWLKENVYTLEPDFYKNVLKNIEGE